MGINTAIEKIHELERFGSVLGLERMTVLLEKLGNPEKNLKIVHVAGTNGKGSICKYIYEVLQADGYKVGLYTSPFLEVFNERIEFDGEYISDYDLEEYTKKVLLKVDEMVADGMDSPTEFEVVTAIAFLYFEQKKSDYVVLEVGLGGRGDSTNVVENPIVTVIASISFDHTDRLGNTLALIAGEKAGIIKNHCPVISGAESTEAKDVIVAKAKEMEAPFYDATQLSYTISKETLSGYVFSTEILGIKYENLEISMVGEHQVKNALIALYAITLIEQENKISLSRKAIFEGMKKAKQIGRFEVMNEFPYVIIDGAHNPDGALALKNAVTKQFVDKKILMIVGILADKDVETVIDTFISITKDFVATEPNNPRKMEAVALADMIKGKKAKCTICKTPREAVTFSLKNEENYDLVLFAGSLYLIGEIRGLLKNE